MHTCRKVRFSGKQVCLLAEEIGAEINDGFWIIYFFINTGYGQSLEVARRDHFNQYSKLLLGCM